MVGNAVILSWLTTGTGTPDGKESFVSCAFQWQVEMSAMEKEMSFTTARCDKL